MTSQGTQDDASKDGETHGGAAADGPETAAWQALTRRAAGDARFVGAALAGVGGTDSRALAARLGCPPENLPRLALCRRPDPEPGRFAEAVRRIAAYAGCDPARLRDLLREADAVERFRDPAGGSDPGRGLLLAARDRLSGPHDRRADAGVPGGAPPPRSPD